MLSGDDTQSKTYDSLPLLLNALPNRLLLDVVKGEERFARRIFQGFAARVQSLALPAVRARLERELPKHPKVIEALVACWQEAYAPLIAILADRSFQPSSETLAPLLVAYSESAVQYALVHSDRDELHEWADRLASIPLPEAPVSPLVSDDDARITDDLRRQIAVLETRMRELQAALKQSESERESATLAISALERRLSAASELETLLRKQGDALEAQLDRERRRARRAEDDADALRHQLRERPITPPPAPEATIADAVALLRQGLERLQVVVPEAPPPQLPPTAPKKPASPARKVIPPEESVTLPGSRGTQAFPIATILNALRRNDSAMIERIRNGLARLADQPDKERHALQKLAKAGIPAAVLTGPLRAAVVDGSNIANMSRQARGKLEYLDQIRRSAWAEGYFPVLIIVDASLRYQIDQPDALMRMVEDGLITMTEPGIPADPVLIREAKARDAVLITNDRMEDWPDVKALERRKASLSHGTVRVGSFHGSSHSWYER